MLRFQKHILQKNVQNVDTIRCNLLDKNVCNEFHKRAFCYILLYFSYQYISVWSSVIVGKGQKNNFSKKMMNLQYVLLLSVRAYTTQKGLLWLYNLNHSVHKGLLGSIYLSIQTIPCLEITTKQRKESIICVIIHVITQNVQYIVS